MIYTFTTGQKVRRSGEGRDEFYFIESGGDFRATETVLVRPGTEYLKVARRNRLDSNGRLRLPAFSLEHRY